MNYPESIYRKYEIVEKIICGEKHYGLVEVKSFFGINYRKHLNVVSFYGYSGWAGYVGDYFPSKWHPHRSIIESAIASQHNQAEYKFKRKMTK